MGVKYVLNMLRGLEMAGPHQDLYRLSRVLAGILEPNQIKRKPFDP